MSVSLQELKNKRLVWNVHNAKHQELSTELLTSSYSSFDRQLGGWPRSGIIELQPQALGIGELRLILPALEALAGAEDSTTKSKLQVWLAPPSDLMPQGLGNAYLHNTICIRPPRQEQVLWVLDTLLNSAVCSALVCWVESLSSAQAKRLQIAAKESGTMAFVIRMPGSNVEESLPVSMRIRLEASEQGIQVHAFKRQNSFPVEPFQLFMQSTFPQLYKAAAGKEAHAYQNNVLSFPQRLEAE